MGSGAAAVFKTEAGIGALAEGAVSKGLEQSVLGQS